MIDDDRTSFQDLSKFELPVGFRGRSAWVVQLWWLVQSTVFRWSPQVAYSFRATLLRLFGAKVGQKVLIRPSAKVTYPWRVEIGDRSWIGDDVVIYSLGSIFIGADTVISQRCYICAADHDYTVQSFPIRSFDVRIESQCWIATDTFVGPGVKIGCGCVVGARSSVFNDLPSAMICVGSPAMPVRSRILSKSG